MKLGLKIFLLAITITNCFSQNDSFIRGNCFTVIVGKDASFDGSVLIAHNEDDAGQLLIDLHKVPESNSPVELLINDSIQIKSTSRLSYLWIDIPGEKFADTYLNEYGVGICSNQARSKERENQGKIDYHLRKIIAAKAKSAKEGLKIATELIETYGYTYSGRSYTIADPNEAWVLEIVKGKIWVAQRVPDSEIVIIPNYYVIDQIDFKDTVNYRYSTQLVSNAVEKKWYNPKDSIPFSFRKVYGDTEVINGEWNISRKWVALNKFSEQHYNYFDNFPFSFEPKNIIHLEDIMNILGNHYEGTEFEIHPDYNNGNPHGNVIMRVCSEYNQTGLIIQLRNWLTPEIGNLIWFAPRRPCINPFVPIYFGVKEFIPEFESRDFQEAESLHFSDNINLIETYPIQSSWLFYNYAKQVDDNYKYNINKISKYKLYVQNQLFNEQKIFEQNMVGSFNNDKKQLVDSLTKFTNKHLKARYTFVKQHLKDNQ